MVLAFMIASDRDTFVHGTAWISGFADVFTCCTTCNGVASLDDCTMWLGVSRVVLQQVVAPFSKPEVTHNSNRNLSCFSFLRFTSVWVPSRDRPCVSICSRGPTVRLFAFAHMIQKQKECSQSALTAVHLSLVVDGLFACFLLVDLFSGCVEDFEFAVLLGPFARFRLSVVLLHMIRMLLCLLRC